VIGSSDVSFASIRKSIHSDIDTLKAAVEEEYNDYQNQNQNNQQAFTGISDWKTEAHNKVDTYGGYYTFFEKLEKDAEKLYSDLDKAYSVIDKKLQDQQEGSIVFDVENSYDQLKGEFVNYIQRAYDDVTEIRDLENEVKVLNLSDENAMDMFIEKANEINSKTADLQSWFNELQSWKNTIETTYSDYNQRATSETFVYNREYYSAMRDVYNFFVSLIANTLDVAGNNNQLIELTDSNINLLSTELSDALTTLEGYEDFADVDVTPPAEEISADEISDIIG